LEHLSGNVWTRRWPVPCAGSVWQGRPNCPPYETRWASYPSQLAPLSHSQPRLRFQTPSSTPA
jgi:hypothetical protein